MTPFFCEYKYCAWPYRVRDRKKAQSKHGTKLR
jgi:hypothetical protein